MWIIWIISIRCDFKTTVYGRVLNVVWKMLERSSFTDSAELYLKYDDKSRKQTRVHFEIQ